MTDIYLSAGVGVLSFVFGFAGILLNRILPESHLTAGGRDMIGAVMGLITLLLALVLGTLVGSAYGVFASQKANMETLGARAIQLDMALEQYGPETTPIRQGLKMAIKGAYQSIWETKNVDPKTLRIEGYLPGLKTLNASIAELKPATPSQQQLMGTIGSSVAIIEQTRLLMSLQLASPIPWPLLDIVVSWALMLFCGYGLLCKFNATTVFVLLVGTSSVASAVFLILELNQPFSGSFRIPSAAAEETIASIGG